MPTPIDKKDSRWYQRAVFYEVAVRGFFDSDGDGFGDFRGLTHKLDYLANAADRRASACSGSAALASRHRMTLDRQAGATMAPGL